MIIDEADDWVTAFREATLLGYRGVSHKNCKGIYKSLHNLALAAAHNARVGHAELFLAAEDLTNLPVVPLQADLASVALLGITHVERNGHHYFRGLGHLSAAEKTAALAAHPDLYERRGDEVFLRITEGMLACASLQVPGMGFAALPDLAAMTPVEDWNFRQPRPGGVAPARSGRADRLLESHRPVLLRRAHDRLVQDGDVDPGALHVRFRLRAALDVAEELGELAHQHLDRTARLELGQDRVPEHRAPEAVLVQLVAHPVPDEALGLVVDRRARLRCRTPRSPWS